MQKSIDTIDAVAHDCIHGVTNRRRERQMAKLPANYRIPDADLGRYDVCAVTVEGEDLLVMTDDEAIVGVNMHRTWWYAVEALSDQLMEALYSALEAEREAA